MRLRAVAVCGVFIGGSLAGFGPATASPDGQAGGAVQAASRAHSTPTTVRVAQVPLQGATGASLAAIGGGYSTMQSGAITAASQRLRTFSLVGATLPSRAMKASDVQLRVRTGTSWGAWQTLADDDSAPDADTAEGRAAARVNSTAPIWVQGATAVQARVRATGAGLAALSAHGAGNNNNGLSLTMVDPGDRPSDDTTEGSLAGGARPRIISRAEWGADESIVCPETDASSQISLAVVHHTAGSNAYSTVAQAKQQLRADMAYHVKGRHWCDLGYNFVVDKWGNIYEGRRGSMWGARDGAHAAGFNKMSVGISMLGNYSNQTPSWATQNAVSKVIAWKFNQYGRNPMDSLKYYAGAGSPRFPKGTLVSLPRVVGHRNVGLTTCPGARGYAQLGSMRRSAANMLGRAAWLRAGLRSEGSGVTTGHRP